MRVIIRKLLNKYVISSVQFSFSWRNNNPPSQKYVDVKYSITFKVILKPVNACYLKIIKKQGGFERHTVLFQICMTKLERYAQQIRLINICTYVTFSNQTSHQPAICEYYSRTNSAREWSHINGRPCRSFLQWRLGYCLWWWLGQQWRQVLI